jgi:uncharacterized protein YjbI with pentapeptide repeats
MSTRSNTTMNAKIRYLRRQLRRAEAELLEATLPTVEQQEELLLPEPGEELTRSVQLELLKTNVEAWNEWYASVNENANLEGAELQGAELQGADLRWSKLYRADLQWANLYRADLEGADLRWSKLRWSKLQGADLRWADLQGADLEDAHLQGADLQRADLEEAHLRGAKLQGANLQWATYSLRTKFPAGFDPEDAGMRLV